MDPETHLEKNRQKLIDKWVDSVIKTYPLGASFFKDSKDPFANPVGHTIKRSIDLLYTEIIRKQMDPAAVTEAMDPIIRLRAVQDFTPSQAIFFIFKIKQLIRQELSKHRQEKNVLEFLKIVETNVDQLMMVAVDIYAKCREKIYLLRINQSKESLKKLLIKKNILCEIPDFESEPQSL